ncbi:MAG: hypothetical protein QM642_10560 [Edaphocola sp.]
MKNKINILVPFIAVTILVACNKNNGYPDGEGTVSFNGEPWKAKVTWGGISSHASTALDINLGFDKLNYKSGLILYSVEKIYGLQRLKSTNYDSLNIVHAVFHSAQEYDVTGDEYEVYDADSTNNWVEITSAEDNFTKEIHGKFSVTMVKTKGFGGSPFPDTVRFTNGSFYISKLRYL